MKILKSWLADWIDVSSIDDNDLSEALESLGFEIENIEHVKPNYKDIVVGKVLEIYQHPNADKVRVTKVDVGSSVYEIVCGAWNFDVNAIVPVALPKSYIKDNFLIDKRDIRGVESNGMICSATELDLWDDHTGILLLDEDSKIGSNFSDTYASTDIIWEIGVTPNRGDCMSHLGVARELSNYFDIPLIERTFKDQSSIKNILTANSGDTELCSSYNSVEIENVQIKESSLLLRTRLSAIGVRVINNVVDYTNYVLHDIGQPLHAFDRDKLFGTVSVRLANEGEDILTLDNQQRKLDSSSLIITDDDKPVALAGVMGGLETEVTDETKNLLIESAYFDKVSIMNTSRKLNLISDASIRFERGIDRNIQNKGLERFVELFEDDQDILYSSIQEDRASIYQSENISLNKDDIKKLLGQDLKEEFIVKTLNNLQIPFEIKDNEIIFEQPSWRYDLERPVDLIEELAKHYGFNNFDSSLPIGNNLNNYGNYWDVRSYMLSKLTSFNYFETQTLSFVEDSSNNLFTPEKESVKVINPIDQTNQFLRTNLIHSLINVYKNNFIKNDESHAYFEINNVYSLNKNKEYQDIPEQIYSLGILLPSTIKNNDFRNENTNIDIYYLVNTLNALLPGFTHEPIERPGMHANYSYSLIFNNKIVGYFGQLSYKLMDKYELQDPIYIAQLNLENISLNQIQNNKYTPLSQYPFLKFDLSFNVPSDFISIELIDEIKNILSENENKISIFDDFYKDDSRNLGVRIETRSYQGTISEEESSELLEKIVNILEKKFKITLNRRG
jgi:phenylalanyl-tRNA synthetase beta chain